MSAVPAVLEEITYVPVLDDNGRRIGWAPSSADRERFEKGTGDPTTGKHAVRPIEPEPQARPYPDIAAELDAWGIGDERLYGQLANLYALEPVIADRIARAAVTGAESGRLHDPTAFLASRLRPGK